MAQNYYPIEQDATVNLPACAFYLAQMSDEPKAQAEILGRIVTHYMAAQEWDLAAQALEPLYDVGDSYEREQRLAELAGHAAGAGNDDFAWALAEACQDETWQDSARNRIALAQAARGEALAARDTALTLGYPEPTLIELAHILAEKDLTAAADCAEDAQEPRARATILTHIATRYAAQDQQGTARELLDEAAAQLAEIDLPDEQAETLCAVALGYAPLDRARAAELIAQAQGIAEDNADDRLLVRVAESWLAMDEPARAAYVAEEIDAFDVSWLWVAIARAQADVGDFAMAQQTLDDIADDYQKARGYFYLARTYNATNDAAASRASLDKATDLAAQAKTQTLDAAQGRENLLAACGLAYLERGDADAARRLAESLPEGASRDAIFQELANRQAADGRFRDALATAQAIGADKRSAVQVELAGYIAQLEAKTTKNWTLARETVEKLEFDAFPTLQSARLELAEFVASHDDATTAEELHAAVYRDALAQPRHVWAASSLAQAATHQARAGNQEQANALFSDAVQRAAQIPDEYTMSNALMDLAAAQETSGATLNAKARAALEQRLPV